MTSKKTSVFVALLFTAVVLASPLRAALLINMVQSGSNVVATLSGSINSWAGATAMGSNNAGVFSGVRPSGATMFFGISPLTGISSTNVLYYAVPAYPTNFGTGTSLSLASSSTASTTIALRNVTNHTIYIDPNYVLGTGVTGVLTWSNASFTSLGVTQGSYLWGWSGDSVTLNIGAAPAPIPEPGTWAAAALLAGAAGYVRWRRRKS